MKTLITLVRAISYALDGPISVPGSTKSDNPVGGDPIVLEGGTYSCPQPAGDWGDDDVLAGIQKAYPTCNVVWAEKPQDESEAQPRSAKTRRKKGRR